MNRVLTKRAKRYTAFLNERVRMWVIKSRRANAELAKAIGVSRQCINNFKKAENDLDHPHLLALGFALEKTYHQITFISEEENKKLMNKD